MPVITQTECQLYVSNKLLQRIKIIIEYDKF